MCKILIVSIPFFFFQITFGQTTVGEADSPKGARTFNACFDKICQGYG